MAEQLLFNLLNGTIDQESFKKWIAGKDVEKISGSLERIVFVTYIVNYIFEETNKYVSVSSSNIHSKVKDNKTDQETPRNTHNEENVEQNDTTRRSPFQVINRITPTKTPNKSFSRHFTQGNDARRNIFNSLSNQEDKKVPSSTPVNVRRRNNSDRELSSPVCPPQNMSPFSQSSSGHSTPCSKNSSGPLMSPQSNSSSFSPTSPQYSDVFPDLGAKGRHRQPQSPCLADFITTKQSSQKSKKRIKPTKLTRDTRHNTSADKNESGLNCVIFGAASRPFVPMNSPFLPQTEMQDKQSFDEERSLLKQKRTESHTPMTTPLKILSRSPAEEEKLVLDEFTTANSSSQTSPFSLPSSHVSFVNPDPGLVTYCGQLVILASVYSACLDVNLVPNIISNIHFIVFLLTANYNLEAGDNVKSMKANVSGKELKEGLVTEMCCKPLKALALEDGPANAKNTCDLIHQTCANTVHVINSVHNCVMFASVVLEKQSHLLECVDKATIHLLLDNRRLSLFVPHFIPQLSQIVKNKESNEVVILPLKRSLTSSSGPVLYQSETDNKDNFSSDINFNLFKKQRDGFYGILHEWKSNNSDSLWVTKRFPVKVQNILGLCTDPINMMHLGRLFCGQLINSKGETSESVPRDRLSLLEARFSRPQGLASAARPPTLFPGLQRFYQQFLQSASGSVFLSHVADNLLYRITVLDSTAFFVDGHSEEESVTEVRSCVFDLCLLAKFLGLVVFLPYKPSDDCSLTPDNLQTQIAVRHLITPPVNTLACLQLALSTNRLLVTVPWVLAFLGMMDPVAPHLPTYQTPLHLLVSVLRSLPFPHLCPHSSFLLRCSLGWLFDSSFFPYSVFFRLASISYPIECSSDADGVDTMAVVGQSLVAELCPGLASLRLLLSGSAGKQGAKRHITPVPIQLTQSSCSVMSVAQNAELKLEESFLSGQPASFRATVEFVVDRLSSSCIKHICSNTIASCKQQAAAAITEKGEKNRLDKQEMKAFIFEWNATTMSQIEIALAEYCGPRVSRALPELLGPDASDANVSRTVLGICGRRCHHRVTTWLNSHINLTEIYTKLSSGQTDATFSPDCLTTPVHKKKAKVHKDSAMSPPDLLIGFHDKLSDCIESKKVLLSAEQLSNLIDDAIKTVRFRSDLIPVANANIYSITVDFCIVLLTYAPNVMIGGLIDRFIALWTVCGQPSDCLSRLLCARNVLLLCQAGGTAACRSWQALADLIVALLRHRLLLPRQLEGQLVAMLRLDWPPMVFSLITTCLSTMLEKILKDPDCNKDPEFLLIIDCVTELTKDLAKIDSLN